MGSVITVNLEEVPFEMPPIPTGDYDLTTEEEPTYEENKQKTGYNIVITWKIKNHDDPMLNGMSIKDWVAVGTQMGRIRLKNILRAAGLNPDAAEISTNDLHGITVRATIKEEPYLDKATGIKSSRSNIAGYLNPEVTA